MALSLSPHQLRQAIDISNTPIKPISSSRQFTTIVHGSKAVHETLPICHAELPLLSSATHDDDMSNLASPRPSQPAPDLPSWTPLRTLGDEDSSISDAEVDELATRKPRDLTIKRLVVPLTNGQAEIKNGMGTTGRSSTQRSPANAKPSKGKKARFDGVFIVTKPPPYKRPTNGRTPRSRAVPATDAWTSGFSLVDALARTFDANKHTEDQTARQSLLTSRRDDDPSTGPQTDVETTEAEDERLQSNTRLPPTLSKRQLGGARTKSGSATASEDAVTFPQDTRERPVKRLKQIRYEANPVVIDAALGTVQAPISWDAEMDFFTRDEGFAVPADVRMAIEGDGITAEKGPAPSSVWSPVETEWHTPASVALKRPVLLPYLSHGAKFRQRLHAAFGETVTVRTDRAARARPVDMDFFVPFDEPDGEPSPCLSESTGSVGSAPVIEEVASAVPSTHITSQSSDNLPSDTDPDQLLGEANRSTKIAAFNANDEEINSWISALQRLVKGKVRVKEEDLEALSIILAEIESVKDNLDTSVPMTLELRESVRQLSELHEIPFGDRNKLRKRAANIFHTWSLANNLS